MTIFDLVISEIRLAEERRARTVIQDSRLKQLVKQLRQKYIADGFLMPFYVWDGRYSRPRLRIKQFGSFILPYSMIGKVFHTGAREGWIRNEAFWFWEYLVSGQEAIFSRPMSSFPDILRIEGMPAEKAWNLLLSHTREMGLFGENGGGIFISKDDLDERHLAGIVPREGSYEGENDYTESYNIPGEPHWINLFYQYEESEYATSKIEVRPAWFHLLNYAFFDVEITRLPVFLCVFEAGSINRINYLDDVLSDRVRDYIGRALHEIPIQLKQKVNTDALRRQEQDMILWLWHNIGNREYKRPLSYQEIADIARKPRGSIQTAIDRFDRKLKENLDGKLLGRLLRSSRNIGLGINMTYRILAERSLAPTREREIDSFDELDKLI